MRLHSRGLVLVSFLFLGVATSARAAFRIDDPKGVLPQADQFLGEIKFESVFKLGDEMAGESRFCRILNGKESCYPPVTIASKVSQVLSDKAVMFTKSGEDDDGSEWVVNRAAFEKVNGNFVAFYLVQGLGGDKPGDQDFDVIEKGEVGEFILANGTKVPAFTATITLNLWKAQRGSYQQKHIALTIGKGLPAISQLLAVQPDPAILKTPIFKVVKYGRAKRTQP